MSWRDSASGSSSFHGGGGMAGNNGTRGAGTGGGSRNTGGGNSGSRTGGLGGGLSTGRTIHGNTAFGPAGGRAVGYATTTPGRGFGMGPTTSQYSNFTRPDGTPMVGGPLQDRPVTARNPQQALGMLQAMQAAQPGRVGGLLSDETVTVGPVAPPVAVVPTAVTTIPPVPPQEEWQWANPAVINPYSQWAGTGAWFEGANYINAGPNGPQWNSSFPTRDLKGDLPDNIRAVGTSYNPAF